jgi:hypothetical protein
MSDRIAVSVRFEEPPASARLTVHAEENAQCERLSFIDLNVQRAIRQLFSINGLIVRADARGGRFKGKAI